MVGSTISMSVANTHTRTSHQRYLSWETHGWANRSSEDDTAINFNICIKTATDNILFNRNLNIFIDIDN